MPSGPRIVAGLFRVSNEVYLFRMGVLGLWLCRSESEWKSCLKGNELSGDEDMEY